MKQVCPYCNQTIKLNRKCCEMIDFQNNILITEFNDFSIEDDKRLLAEENIDAVKDRSAYLINWLHDLTVKKLQYNMKDVKVLSIGCGLGYDIEHLKKLGYDVYGIEPVNRIQFWSNKFSNIKNRFAVASDRNIPYPDNYFDIIFAGEVIEHVGTVNHETEINNDTFDRRAEFIFNLSKKIKNSGSIILTCPNKNFIFDFSHSHEYLPHAKRMF
jgi:SAM-dependent methyltransferase